MTDETCKPCESTAVRITRIVLKWCGKHMALTKKIFTIIAWAIFIFCAGAGVVGAGFVIKNYFL